ncbi:MAG TPA: glycosyltransferase [Kineosporiaceae bacterium]|nr:glycosyltransferase [Kineosporiaceae bacterium]
MNRRVSVVMMTRDRREQVLATLRHLHDLPERPPVILVDNGSTDHTVDAVRRHFPEVTVLPQERNLGATARTLGVQAARTPYVAFSDDDSWWAPGSLDRAADRFDAAPRLGLLAARILIGPEERLDPICRQMTDSPLALADDLPGPPVLGFIACGAVVRRAAYLQVGGFNPVVFFFGEEAVLAQDLAAAGWGLAYVDDVVAHHHPQPGPTRVGRRRLEMRNRLLSTWLRRPWRTVLRQTWDLTRQARDSQVRGALWDAVQRLPAVWLNRRTLPAGVEADVRALERTNAGQSQPGSVSRPGPVSSS